MIEITYELLGRVTAVVLAVVFTVGVGLFIMTIMGVILDVLITVIINKVLWRGYDIKGEHPPEWRRKTSIFLNCLRNRDFSDYNEKLENIKRYED